MCERSGLTWPRRLLGFAAQAAGTTQSRCYCRHGWLPVFVPFQLPFLPLHICAWGVGLFRPFRLRSPAQVMGRGTGRWRGRQVAAGARRAPGARGLGGDRAPPLWPGPASVALTGEAVEGFGAAHPLPPRSQTAEPAVEPNDGDCRASFDTPTWLSACSSVPQSLWGFVFQLCQFNLYHLSKHPDVSAKSGGKSRWQCSQQSVLVSAGLPDYHRIS